MKTTDLIKEAEKFVQDLGFNNLKEGSCFWGHKWTKWELRNDFTAMKFLNDQERTCIKCGKYQRKTVRR